MPIFFSLLYSRPDYILCLQIEPTGLNLCRRRM